MEVLHENEILVWLLGTVVLIFLMRYGKQLRHLPAPSLLFAAFLSGWLGWTATNMEHLFFYQFLNLIEHLGYALNGVLLFVWCSLVFSGKQEQKADDQHS